MQEIAQGREDFLDKGTSINISSKTRKRNTTPG